MGMRSKDFADKVNVELDVSLTALEEAGIRVISPDRTMTEIAEENDITPQQIFEVIKPTSQQEATSTTMPEEAPGGTGKRTVAQICEQYQLDVKVVVEGLQKAGLIVEADQIMKNVAAANNADPHAIYNMIYELQK